MLNPEEANKCVSDTQETYYEGANEDTKEKTSKETQNINANESQDFRLMFEDESMSEKMKPAQNKEAIQQKSLVEQLDVQQIPDASQLKTNDEVITTNNKETKTNEDKKSTQNKVKENISDDICDLKKKDELSDEDEIIQGTPFQHYSPKAVSNIDVTSLKRKADSFEEPLAKVPKTLSQEDTANAKKRCEEEESRQSCESDNSYEDLFKDIEKNVIIEETQDVDYLELTQNCLKNHPEHATKTTNDKVREHQDEQINQQQTFPEIRDVEKDENLNLSAKVTDTSANDSIVVNMNSTIENDSRTEDNSLSLETKENIIATNAIINDRPKIEMLNETNQSIEMKNTETVSNESNKSKQMSDIEVIEKIADNEEIPSSQTNVPEATLISRKSRTSIEVIYDSVNNELRSKVEIDDEVQIEDDGVKIVDSSAEVVEIVDDSREKVIDDTSDEKSADDSHSRDRILESLEKGGEVKTVYQSSLENKTCSDISYRSTAESAKESSLDSKLTMEKQLVNGSRESKRNESTDATLSVESDTNLSGCETLTPHVTAPENVTKPTSDGGAKSGSFAFKDPDNNELFSISDHDSSNAEDKSYVLTKILEREVDMYLKLKCLITIDEKTKECVRKEVIAVQCEPTLAENSATMGKQKNEDSQGSLADISDNRDSSPGSVNTNPQLFQLPSRLSMMSTVGSSSSASSAASLATRLALKNIPFPIPIGPAKHARKTTQEGGLLPKDKQALEEICDRMTHEWKNHQLLTTKVLNCANAELFAAGTEAYVNISNERLDDHHHHVQKSSMRSSTPEAATSELELAVTPKSRKKSKVMKRARSKITKSTAQANGENDNVPSNSEIDVNTSPNRKKSKVENDDKLLISDNDVLANSSPQNAQIDDLVGKIVFAKWSDKNYYPGTVIDRVKTKYKVNFYDGKSKILIPEFVIPILKTLREGLSVYATTGADDYGSCGIIVDVQISECNADDVYYTVATDEGERLRVQIHDISLSADQALVLKEEMDIESKGSLPSTPKAFGQVTLDNMVDGKRRSKRIGNTPSFLTPKSRSNTAGTSCNSASIKAEPSVSGMSTKLKKNALSENESMSSDSNVEVIQDEYVLRGVQREINGTPYEQRIKGSQNKVKSKPRSKKKKNEDPQMIIDLGPIPPSNSNIFKGMSFILACASLESLDRFKYVNKVANTKTENIETDIETENEEDWQERPFVRDRLQAQILAGGGKLYEEFNQIPQEEYKSTKLITNVPNTTAKSILCLSVGIHAYNHKWIIRCCLEGKLVSAAEDALPVGWSIHKKDYVESFQASDNRPLTETVVIIPALKCDTQFATFWRQVCENAGAIVIIIESSESMKSMDFDSDIVIVSNHTCPSWAVNKASQLQIPVLSTTWVIQCLIEGKLCPYDQQPHYKYNYLPN